MFDCALNLPNVLYSQIYPLDWDRLMYHPHFELPHWQPLHPKISSSILAYSPPLKAPSSRAQVLVMQLPFFPLLQQLLHFRLGFEEVLLLV